MTRREFTGGMGMMAAGSGAAEAAQQGRKPNFYLLQNYYLKNGTQTARINEYMSLGFLPAASKVHSGPMLFLEAIVAAHQPQFVCILGLNSADEFTGMMAAMRKDADFQKALSAWESGEEAPYEHYSQTLLRATEYSPGIEISAKDAKPRIFELRTYHSPTWK